MPIFQIDVVSGWVTKQMYSNLERESGTVCMKYHDDTYHIIVWGLTGKRVYDLLSIGMGFQLNEAYFMRELVAGELLTFEWGE